MRFEIKVPIFFTNLNFLKSQFLSFKGLKRHYGNRLVSSIYFDTKDLMLANYNIEGISNRYKFRLRWYNNAKSFNYEIKKKINKFSEKKIYTSSCDLNSNFIKKFSKKNLDLFNQLNNEEKFLIGNLNLLPVLKVKYLREYFIYKNKVRLTIDHRPSYKTFNSFKNIKKQDSFTIIEFKFDNKNYELASSLIKEFRFTPKRYSKYIKGLSTMGKISYI